MEILNDWQRYLIDVIRLLGYMAGGFIVGTLFGLPVVFLASILVAILDTFGAITQAQGAVILYGTYYIIIGVTTLLAVSTQYKPTPR